MSSAPFTSVAEGIGAMVPSREWILRTVAHRLGNNSTRPAISLHVYGAPFDRLGIDVNHVWNEDR